MVDIGDGHFSLYLYIFRGVVYHSDYHQNWFNLFSPVDTFVTYFLFRCYGFYLSRENFDRSRVFDQSKRANGIVGISFEHDCLDLHGLVYWNDYQHVSIHFSLDVFFRGKAEDHSFFDSFSCFRILIFRLPNCWDFYPRRFVDLNSGSGRWWKHLVRQ